MSYNFMTIYDLVNEAINRTVGVRDGTYDVLVDRVMGNGFFNKSWLKVDDVDVDSLGRPYVSQAEYEKLKLYAGPHGYALWRAEQARGKS